MTSDVFSFGKDIVGLLLPVLTFILGKATKGGANQQALDSACAELAKLRDTVAQQALTLASHTTLHTGYIAANGRIETQLAEMNRLLGELSGRISRA